MSAPDRTHQLPFRVYEVRRVGQAQPLGYVVEDYEGHGAGRLMFPMGLEGMNAAGDLAAKMNAPYIGKGGRKEGGGKTASPPRRPKGSARGRRAAWTERYGDKT